MFQCNNNIIFLEEHINFKLNVICNIVNSVKLIICVYFWYVLLCKSYSIIYY